MITSLSTPPPNFIVFNARGSKNLVIAVDIDGLDLLTSIPITIAGSGTSPLVYGDPVTYGETGITYGGTLPGVSSRQSRALLSLTGGALSISQKLEPEQGRGSISTITMSFVDQDQYMSQAVASGPIVPEILGRQARIWIGYAETQFPGDYFVVWRGRVGQINSDPGKVTIQFVDPNVVRKQQVFYTAQTTTSLPVLAADSTINVVGNGNFHKKIAGPFGAYDQFIKAYIKIDNEFIEYQQSGAEATGFGTNQFVGVSRGARGTTPADHAQGATVDSFIELSGRAMDIALKIMLSGWDGNYLNNQLIAALVTTGDVTNPTLTNGIILPFNVDAVRDLGITPGDQFTLTMDAIPGNNVTGKVIGFNSINGMANNAILTDQTFTASSPSSAELAIRSQYDVWPVSCGTQLPGWEVDVAQHQYYQNTFLSSIENSYRFLINSEDTAKTFIESQIFLPIGAYSLTRQGKISVGLTKPPIADQRSQILTVSNVIDPQMIQVQRGVNNRKFFNEIDWTFDYADDGTSLSTRKALDSASLNIIGISSVLPIDAKGARTDLGFQAIAAEREQSLLTRYSRGSVILSNVKTNLAVGNQVEVGDELVVQDNGQLQILNFTTGVRNFGTQLVEVIGRALDLIAGVVTLQLEGGTGAFITDRFATISPSSILAAGATTTRIVITESFGAVFPGQEQLKWTPYIGLLVRVHNPSYSNDSTSTFTGFDPTNSHAMLLSPALNYMPAAGDIVEIGQFPTDTNPLNQALYKLIHCFLDPSVAITSGVDTFSFNVAIGDAPKFIIGNPVRVHNFLNTVVSPETVIVSVVGTLVTVRDSLGFIPDNTMKAEYLGFADGSQPYRLI